MKGLSWLIVSQMVVTLALLGLAYAIGENDPTTRSLIVGAVIGNWFKEGSHLGREVAEQRVARQQQGQVIA